MDIQLTFEEVQYYQLPEPEVPLDENGFAINRLRSQFAFVSGDIDKVSDDGFDILLISSYEAMGRWSTELETLREHLVKRALNPSYTHPILKSFPRSSFYLNLMEELKTSKLLEACEKDPSVWQNVVFLALSMLKRDNSSLASIFKKTNIRYTETNEVFQPQGFRFSPVDTSR